MFSLLQASWTILVFCEVRTTCLGSLTRCWVCSRSSVERSLGMGPQCQAVLLAGGAGASLFPLNHTGNPLALFPVANQPLITYALHTLEQAGVLDVLVVRTLLLARGNTYIEARPSELLSMFAYLLRKHIIVRLESCHAGMSG